MAKQQRKIETDAMKVEVQFSSQEEMDKAGLALAVTQREISPMTVGGPMSPIREGTIYGIPFSFHLSPPF